MSENVKSKKESFIKFLKELIPYVIILIAVILIRTFLFTPIYVRGSSMKPTLSGGEVMLLNKVSKHDRLDVVVVDIGTEKIIKRVIGLPNEYIECRDGIVYINDKKLDDKHSIGAGNDFKRTKLKKDEYFVLGDNRYDSLDSDDFGPIKESQIQGTANFVLFPFREFGKLK